MKSKIKLWFLLTIALGVVATMLAANYLKKIETEAVQQVMEPVVLASQKIPQGTRITREMLVIKEMPAEFIHSQAISDPNDVVEKFSTVDLLPEQPILSGQLTSENTAKELPYKIPEGKRAITIAVNSSTGVGGHIKPGHKVDILVSYEVPEEGQKEEEAGVLKVITLLQDVEVLAVGADLQKKEELQPAENVTLAVAPEQAQNLFLAESVGKIKLILRPAGKENVETLKATDLEQIRAQFE